MRHLELFAGIGGFRKAIDLLGENHGIEVSCAGFSEIDKYAVTTYKANYHTEGETEIGDINVFNDIPGNVGNLPDFDLLSGGFPCQPFSMMGKQNGFDDHRGNVFYRIIEILETKSPRFVLLENVKNLFNHNNGETFREVLSALRSAGYGRIYYDIFNTKDFGLAQVRNRVFIFAVHDRVEEINIEFDQKKVTEHFHSAGNRVGLLIHNNVLDVLDREADPKYYLTEKIKPTILSNGTKNFRSRSEINQMTARPLTASMAKMHRACQDNYYSDAFLQSENPEAYAALEFSKDELAGHRIRRITPLEALKFQGFGKVFYENAKKAGVSDSQLYKQAGNAISVNTVYAILQYLFIQNGLIGQLEEINQLNPQAV